MERLPAKPLQLPLAPRVQDAMGFAVLIECWSALVDCWFSAGSVWDGLHDTPARRTPLCCSTPAAVTVGSSKGLSCRSLSAPYLVGPSQPEISATFVSDLDVPNLARRLAYNLPSSAPGNLINRLAFPIRATWEVFPKGGVERNFIIREVLTPVESDMPGALGGQ